MKKEQKQCLLILSAFFFICFVALSIAASSKTTAYTPHTSSSGQSSNLQASASAPIPADSAAPAFNVSYMPTSASPEDHQDELTLNMSISNTWKENNKVFTQLDGIITNTSNTEISGWQIYCTLPTDSTLSQSWNGTYTLKNGQLTIMPVDYNKSIAAHSSIQLGYIISSSQDITSFQAAINDTKHPASHQADDPSPVPLSKPLPAVKSSSKEDSDWLYTKGNKIIDKNGQQVWLTGINWFGYNTGTNTFDGLWNANLDQSIAAIADHGFNLLRIPISAELINNWSRGTYPTANYNESINPSLKGKNSQHIFDYMLSLCKKNGLKVMLDIHSAETDASGHMTNVWYTSKISEADYLSALSYMAACYADNDTIIAYDLKNEPHGKPNESPKAIWNNSKALNNWKYIAEKAASTVLSKNPNVLIMVEGIEIYPKDIKKNSQFTSQNSGDYYFNWWGGNLRGVKDYPINLGKYQNKLVYSPHDYGPAVYAQPWFKSGYTYNSLYKDCWRDNWFYIYENNTAPLLIGEWGGYMSEPNLTWMTDLRQLIIKFKIHHTFWCFNANSGDTGGLVLDDFTTWDTKKYNFVKEALWQKDGKFVGLDHETPLGKNGISLQKYSQ